MALTIEDHRSDGYRARLAGIGVSVPAQVAAAFVALTGAANSFKRIRKMKLLADEAAADERLDKYNEVVAGIEELRVFLAQHWVRHDALDLEVRAMGTRYRLVMGAHDVTDVRRQLRRWRALVAKKDQEIGRLQKLLTDDREADWHSRELLRIRHTDVVDRLRLKLREATTTISLREGENQALAKKMSQQLEEAHSECRSKDNKLEETARVTSEILEEKNAADKKVVSLEMDLRHQQDHHRVQLDTVIKCCRNECDILESQIQSDKQGRADDRARIDTLHQRIGELTAERDHLLRTLEVPNSDTIEVTRLTALLASERAIFVAEKAALRTKHDEEIRLRSVVEERTVHSQIKDLELQVCAQRLQEVGTQQLYKAELDGLRRSLSIQIRLLASERQTNADHTTLIAELRGSLEAKDRELASARQQYETMERDCTAEARKLCEERDVALSELVTSNATIGSLTHEVDDLQERNIDLYKGMLDCLLGHDKAVDWPAKIRDLEDRLEHASQCRFEDLTEFQDELAAKDASISDLSADLQKLRSKETELEALVAKSLAARQDLDELTKEHNALKVLHAKCPSPNVDRHGKSTGIVSIDSPLDACYNLPGLSDENTRPLSSLPSFYVFSQANDNAAFDRGVVQSRAGFVNVPLFGSTSGETVATFGASNVADDDQANMPSDTGLVDCQNPVIPLGGAFDESASRMTSLPSTSLPPPLPLSSGLQTSTSYSPSSLSGIIEGENPLSLSFLPDTIPFGTPCRHLDEGPAPGFSERSPVRSPSSYGILDESAPPTTTHLSPSLPPPSSDNTGSTALADSVLDEGYLADRSTTPLGEIRDMEGFRTLNDNAVTDAGRPAMPSDAGLVDIGVTAALLGDALDENITPITSLLSTTLPSVTLSNDESYVRAVQMRTLDEDCTPDCAHCSALSLSSSDAGLSSSSSYSSFNFSGVILGGDNPFSLSFMPDAIPFGTSVHRARDEGSPPDLSRRSSTHHRSLDGILDENASPTNPHLSSSLPPLSNDNASSSASTDTALDESYLLDSCSTLLDETKDTDKSRTSNENSAKDANRPSMPFDARLVDVRVPEAPLSDVFGDCIAPVVPFPLSTSLHSRRPRITPRPTFRGLLWATTRTPSESLANSVLDEEFLPTARHLPSPSQKLASRRPRGCR